MAGEKLEDDDLAFIGEQPTIPPEALAQLPQQTEARVEGLTILRRVADLEDETGTIHRVGLDEMDVTPNEQVGKFDVFLRSHKKWVIVGGAALLFATGAGVQLQRNRTQRKKMIR